MYKFVSAVLLTAISSQVFAESSQVTTEEGSSTQSYAGISIGSLKLKEDGFELLEPKFPTLMLRTGAKFNQYASGEVRFGLGISTDDTTIDGIRFESELDYVMGAYLKLGAGEQFHPYALVGYNKAEVTIKGVAGGNSASISDTESDIAFGLGLDVKLNERFQLNAECVNFYDENDVSLSGCLAGVTTFF